MARYCFYCGRALSSGEKCNCRATGYSSSSSSQASGNAGSAGSAGSATQQQAGGSAGSTRAKSSGYPGSNASKSGANSRESLLRRLFRAFNPFDGTPPRPPKAKKSRSSQAYSRTNQTSARRKAAKLTPQAILAELRRVGAYLVLPADSIREAAQAGSRRVTLLILIFQGILGGAFFLVASRQTILRRLLDLSVSTINHDGAFIGNLFIFVQGFGFSLAGNLLLAVIYLLALRLIFRQTAGYIRLLTALGPSCLYFSVFLLAGLISLPASFFSALMMLIAGVAVATVAQFLAARTLSGFDDNRNLILVTLVMLVFTGVIAMLLNLSIPMLEAMLNSTAVI